MMPKEALQASQAARDAAADVLQRGIGGYKPGPYPPRIQHGNADDHPLVQAFARLEADAYARGLEEAAKVAEMHDHRGDIAAAIRAHAQEPRNVR